MSDDSDTRRSEDESRRVTDAAGDTGRSAVSREPDGVDYERFGRLGGGVYLVVGLGAALTMFLYALFAGSSTVVGPSAGSAELYIAAANAFTLVLQMGPLLAVALGVYVTTLDHDASDTIAAAAATGIGSAVTLVVLAVLLVVFEPSGISMDLADALVAAVGAVLGNAATGAAGAYLPEFVDDL